MKLKKIFLIAIMIFISSLGMFGCDNGQEIRVNFLKNGKIVHNIQTEGMESLIMPENPVEEGQVFVGWYLDEEFTQIFTKEHLLYDKLEKSLNVYAKFITEEESLQEFNVTLNFKDGEDKTWTSGDNFKVKYYNLFNLPMPTKENYIFTGWYDSEDNNYSFNGTKVFHYTNDLSLVAKYIPKTQLDLTPGIYNKDTSILIYSWDKLISRNLLTIENDTLKKVDTSLKGDFIISKGIKTIDENALENCSSIYDIYFEKEAQIENINKYAFKNMTNLKSIKLPNSIKNLGTAIFFQCIDLEEVVFAVDSTFTTIPAQAFRMCTSLETINIPNSVVTIESEAFMSCNELEEVNFGESSALKTLANRVFRSCTSLESITLPVGVTSVSNSMFEYCENLTTITFNGEITSIGELAFAHCENLNEFTIVDTVTFIGKNAFYFCTELDTITFENLENWYVLENQYDEVGQSIDFSNAENNVTLIKNTHENKFFKVIKP